MGESYIPVPAGKVGKHVEAYEVAADAGQKKLVRDGEVSLIDVPTPVTVEATRDGWVYCRPTEGPLKGKLLVVRESRVVADKK